jgi:imidazolonepropionase-like amidohydrolase
MPTKVGHNFPLPARRPIRLQPLGQVWFHTTVLTGPRIIDGTGKAPLENGAIAFDGDEITAIGPADRIQIPQRAQVVNAQGKTIIPGLISAHSHLGLCEGALGPN